MLILEEKFLKGIETFGKKEGQKNIELLRKFHVTAMDKNGNIRIPHGANNVIIC